jgi:DNA-binding beta-propeller fold protein YncE
MVVQRVQAVALVFLLLLTACKKEPAPAPAIPTEGRRIYVLCEGSLGRGDAALGVYLPGKDSVYTDAFGAANGSLWGDVAQSLMITDNEIFICVNNSDKILVADRATFRLRHSIAIRKPRYIQPINDSVAMVSTLFSNTLFRLSLKSHAVTDSLKLARQNPEGMATQNGLLYVCPWDKAADKLYVVEDGRRVVDSISVGQVPHTIALDKNGFAWVLSGNASEGIMAKLTRVNLSTRTTQATYSFPGGADPIRLAFNPTRDTLYYIGVNYNGGTAYNGVFRMAIGDGALPATPFVSGQANQYFWGVGVDPRTSTIYIGDPAGWGGQGIVRLYTPQGTLIKDFRVGTGPGQFYFD